jgi:uncharacterized protein
VTLRRLRSAALLASLGVLRAVPLEAQSSSGSDPREEELIREILDVTRAADQVTTAIETSVPMQRAANPRVPPVFWDRFLAETRARRGEFVDSLIPLYSRSFDLADLKAMLELYQSPFGQRLLRIQPRIMQESMLLGQRWGARVGADIGRQLAAEGIQIQP